MIGIVKNPRKLKVGDKFKYEKHDTQVFEVVRVTDCSATCKPLAARHSVIKDKNGEVVAEFDAAGAVFHISSHSSVYHLGEKE